MNSIARSLDNNVKRYPRTLQEAFGPYTSRQIWTQPDPIHPRDRIVIQASIAAAIAGIVVLFIFG